MESVDIGPVRLQANRPVLVWAAPGHEWFPVIDRFPGGEVVAMWSTMPDVEMFAYQGLISHSTDGGHSWQDPYAVGNWFSVRHPMPDGALRGVPYYVYPRPRGQAHTFATHLVTVRPGGRHQIAPYAVSVKAFPRPLSLSPTGAAVFVFDGNILDVGGRWITTMYGRFEGDALYSLVLMSSSDKGLSWTYETTIACGDDTPGAPEGPCEATLEELDGGQLVCVYRIGSGVQWNYRASRSADEGRSWTKPEVLDGPRSVEPCLRRLNSGLLALSGGRPGLFLWLCTDGACRQWHTFDVLKHHNTTCGHPEWLLAEDGSQTTAYTEIVEIEPDRLLYIYDRIPMGWRAVPADSPDRNMIFVVEIHVERK